MKAGDFFMFLEMTVDFVCPLPGGNLPEDPQVPHLGGVQ